MGLRHPAEPPRDEALKRGCGVVFLIHCFAEDMAGTARYLGVWNPREDLPPRLPGNSSEPVLRPVSRHHLLPGPRRPGDTTGLEGRHVACFFGNGRLVMCAATACSRPISHGAGLGSSYWRRDSQSGPKLNGPQAAKDHSICHQRAIAQQSIVWSC